MLTDQRFLFGVAVGVVAVWAYHRWAGGGHPMGVGRKAAVNGG